MADIFSKERRSELMSKITGKDTKPEMAVRSFLFRQGLRFRKNVKKLPGTPDIVLSKYKTVIFIHGCFWHGHTCKKGTTRPATNPDFWNDKIQKNIERDVRTKGDLEKLGWTVIIVWGCEMSNKTKFDETLSKLLERIFRNNK